MPWRHTTMQIVADALNHLQYSQGYGLPRGSGDFIPPYPIRNQTDFHLLLQLTFNSRLTVTYPAIWRLEVCTNIVFLSLQGAVFTFIYIGFRSSGDIISEKEGLYLKPVRMAGGRRSLGNSNTRPVHAVDLVSNSERMLRAHRRNQHQGQLLNQRLNGLDRKLRHKVYRAKHDIHRLYFEEELPRQLEALEVDTRRNKLQRTAECSHSRGGVIGIDHAPSRSTAAVSRHNSRSWHSGKSSIHSGKSTRNFTPLKLEDGKDGLAEPEIAKTPAQIIESVRAVARRMPIVRPRHDVISWRQLAPSVIKRPPPTKPQPNESGVEERFKVFMEKVMAKTASDGYRLPYIFDGIKEDLHIDFDDPKWRPYKILIDKDKQLNLSPSQSPVKERGSRRSSAFQNKYVDDLYEHLRFSKNMRDGEGDGGSETMSFAFSASQSHYPSPREGKLTEEKQQSGASLKVGNDANAPATSEGSSPVKLVQRDQSRVRFALEEDEPPKLDMQTPSTRSSCSDIFSNGLFIQLGLDHLRMVHCWNKQPLKFDGDAAKISLELR